MRLDKLLANMGYGSRTEMKKVLKSGVVTVNGEVIKNGKIHVNPEQDSIYFQGLQVEYKQHVYLMLNKPSGVVSATEDAHEQTVVDLLEAEDLIFDVFPVGRLDKDTEGFLLLTNDGKLAHELLSPKHHVPKIYYARIQGQVTEEDQQAFQEGIVLDDGYVTIPAHLHIVHSGTISEVQCTLYEGKYHQVKRMFLARGMQVIYLKRTQMGGLPLDEQLGLGEYRELDADELEQLKQGRG